MRSADTPAVPRSGPVDPPGLASAAAIGGQAGHYLTVADPETRDLTALAVHGFAEELDVYLDAAS